jgi:diadenosine tetraphosphate (Ap4A) HIT family hydrolase
MDRQAGCVFCAKDFPCEWQLISDAPDYWLFVLNIKPQTDLHATIVLKHHVYGLTDNRLSIRAMKEFGIVLKKASMSIKKADPSVQRVLVVSLNSGKASKHLHFHLIPKRLVEPVKMLNKPKEDGNGMFFLGRKEITAGTFVDFLNSTTGNKSNKLKKEIEEAIKDKITKNAQQLRTIFGKIWITQNN